MMRLALIFVITACSWAQLKIDLHPVTGRASDRLIETQRRLRTARQSSWRDAKAEEELAVLDAVAKIYSEHFQPQLNSQPRIATLTEKGNDILVARWTASGNQSVFSELIVWDTPENTSFILQLPRRSWASESAIRSTFERLLLSPSPDGRTPPAVGVTLNVARDVQTHQWIGAGGLLVRYGPRQFDEILNWIDLWETTAASYLCASFSMRVTYGFPPKMRSIPERFPPLESRVGQWSKKRILDELGLGRSAERDRVLARELMKRDLTDDELLALLEIRRRTQNGAVLQAIIDAGQVPRFSNTIRKYLEGDRSGYRDKSAASHPFGMLSRTEEVNFTDVALEVLRQDVRADDAYHYAAANGTTAADYRALKALPRLENAFMSSRDEALKRMRMRLGLDEDGNPIAK